MAFARRAAVFGALLFCGAAFADGSASTSLTLSGMPKGYAAASYQAPVAFGASWGSVGLAATQVWGADHGDASIAAGLGLGNPDSLGVDVGVVISSLSKSDGGYQGFGEEGSFALKLHRNLGDYTAVAIGANAIGRWGGDVYMDRNTPGYYAAVTHALLLGDTVLMLSGGAGDDVVHPRGDFDLFGSAALYLAPWASVIAEYTGFSTNAALSIAPLPQWLPLTVTVGAVDIARRHNDNIRVLGMVNFGFQF